MHNSRSSFISLSSAGSIRLGKDAAESNFLEVGMNFLLEDKYVQDVQWRDDQNAFDSNDERRQVNLCEPEIEDVVIGFRLYEHVSYQHRAKES